eukprot:6986879-Alexandrium_andersonii.AAC.1
MPAGSESSSSVATATLATDVRQMSLAGRVVGQRVPDGAAEYDESASVASQSVSCGGYEADNSTAI